MILTLPDRSRAHLDPATFRFTWLRDADRDVVREFPGAVADPEHGAALACLREFAERPQRRFGDCFRRISDHPRYSPIGSKHDFELLFLPALYLLPGLREGGGTFCSSDSVWRFLDGGIRYHSGYGWGDRSWELLEGCEVLRAACVFFGIRQPLRIKGEGDRRPLAAILEDMTAVPSSLKALQAWSCPWRPAASP